MRKSIFRFATFLICMMLAAYVNAQTPNTSPLPPTGEIVIGNHLHAGDGNEVWSDATSLYFNYRGNAATTNFWNLGGSTGSSVMTLVNSGKVGIGTTSPQEALHVNGNIRGNINGALRINSGNGYIDVGAQNSGFAHFYTDRPGFFFGNPITVAGALNSYNTYDLTLQTGGTTRMSIVNSTGNVGIGTTTPINKLEVDIASSNTNSGSLSGLDIGLFLKNTNATTNNFNLISFGDAVGYGVAYVGALIKDHTNHSGNLLFATKPSGSPVTERMRIDENGNVGIGTASPVYGRLQVTQQSNAYDQGIALLSSAGQRSMRIWVDENNAYVYAGMGQANLILNSTGNVGIGTTNPDSYKLAVEGKIGAREVNVIATNPWPDYVFEKNYKLPSLEEIKNYIDQNQHLPEVPSAKEVEKGGLNLGEMNALLLKKIEELTLHLIKQEERIKTLESKIKE